MKKSATILLAVLLLLLHRGDLASAQPRSVPFWPIARSTTWNGTPDPRTRYMATTGLSEWSTGLQLSGFRGAAELEPVEAPPPPGVRKFARVTALKARVTGVFQQGNQILVQVSQQATGYEVVDVDLSCYALGTRLTFTFRDPAGRVVARQEVLIE